MNVARNCFFATAALAGAMMGGLPAQSSIETRQALQAQPRAWSAMANVDAQEVLDRTDSFALDAASAADTPYCDADAKVAQTLAHDFGESLVDDTKVGSANTQLWGSPVMGTWTLVVARADKTSCIIASGLGYGDNTNPDTYYAAAGISG